MRIGSERLSGELETLEHKRGRLRDILASGVVGPQMRADLEQMLGQIERRVSELRQRDARADRLAA